MADDVFERLMAQIHQRARSLPENSYTTRLIQGGTAKMGAKIREEAEEVIQAADECLAEPESARSLGDKAGQGRSHLVYEACDLIYHLWVLLGSHGIQVDQLRAELERREGLSGLEEKRRRGLAPQEPPTAPGSN
jgi:phosphoribosyl-ATP pyrophosphohydrolase